jgi:hypothetical protein
MLPTLQNTRAQRNAALARSSSSTGNGANVRYWHCRTLRDAKECPLSGVKRIRENFRAAAALIWIDARKQFGYSNAAKNFFTSQRRNRNVSRSG